jgi:hypothetical protein
MNFIKKIFKDEVDEETHRQFSKFGKGVFDNRALVEIYKKNQLKIKTGPEFVNEFVLYLINKLDKPTLFKGAIMCKQELTNILPFDVDIKQYMGIKKYLINQELTKEDILKVLEEAPKAYFLLSFNSNFGKFKCKVKSPKSGKPGKDGEEPKADFCSFTTKNINFDKEFLFDVNENYNEVKINHTFKINSIEIPEEYKNDFKMAREFGKRKGKIVRKINIDGKEIIKEKEFIA